MIRFNVKGKEFRFEIPMDSFVLHNEDVSDERVVVLLNNTCNFNCIYCYSAIGRQHGANPNLCCKDIIPVIDYVCKKQEAKQDGCIKVSFYGGGEPFVSRDVLRETIEYISKRAKHIRREIKIMTNGSLLCHEDILWLKEHNVSLVFSFEVLEDIQNEQRKHYAIVDKNIKMIDEAGIKYRIWSVVTPRNVRRMEELLYRVKENYPNVERLNIESVVSDECSIDLQEQFLKSYLKVRKLANELGIQIVNSRIGCFDYPRLRHCQPELCITNEGYYTICHTTSSNPKVKDLFNFGKDLEHFVQDKEAVRNVIRKCNINNCEQCIAKPFCAGGCVYVNMTESNIVAQSICKFMINTLKVLIIEKEDKKLFNEYLESNMSFDEFANS